MITCPICDYHYSEKRTHCPVCATRINTLYEDRRNDYSWDTNRLVAPAKNAQRSTQHLYKSFDSRTVD